MSTLGQPHLEPAWKQEVSRRIAAHKNRKGAPSGEAPATPDQLVGNSRAAEAAARVAARYAKAKSYTQMQAEEARLAVRAAEIATQVALEAQATAENALAGLHAASNEPASRGPAVVESITRARAEEPAVVAVIAEPQLELIAEPVLEIEQASPQVLFVAATVIAPQPAKEPPCLPAADPIPVVTRQMVDGKNFGIRWEPDMPVRVLEPKAIPSQENFELSVADWWTPAQVSATLRHEPISIETQPAQANLIEFPRELVATRKMRPRLVEPAAAPESQLSIFEVDPGAVSTEPPPAVTAAAAETAWSAPEWSAPEWSGIELDEHPQEQHSAQPETAPQAQSIFLAPFGRRLMAVVVDGALIMAAFIASAMMLVSRMGQVPAPKSMEAMIVCGLVLAGFLYHAFFFALGASTPGMRYAGIALCTFDEESPNRAQLRWRLGATALSLVPMGLGFVWSVFDEDHLTWHDRISQTYLRKL